MYLQSQNLYYSFFVFVFVMHKNVNENMMNIEFNHYNLCKGQSQVKYTYTYILQFSLLEIFNNVLYVCLSS